jgi:HK97 family phage portal protein
VALKDWFKQKAIPAPGSIVFFINGTDATLPSSIEAYAREGYQQNPIAYFCANTIARACASVQLEVWQYDKNGNRAVLNTHPLLDLLQRPNPTQSWDDFFTELVTWHRIAGEAYVLRLPATGKPVELQLLNPSYVGVEEKEGSPLPVAFTYGTGNDKKRYPVRQTTGECQVLQIKTFNPSNPMRGLSPLSPAARDVDNHNAGNKWNGGLLRNSARPSGVIEATGNVSETTISQLKEHFQKVWSGIHNVGRIPILTGGLKFTALSLNPKDMEFGKGMAEAAKNTALVYGVPLPLVTTDAATFSNMDAAQERLWTDTILPLLDSIIGSLSAFLMPFYTATGKNVVLGYNSDSVAALEPRRERLFKRMALVVAGGIVTPDEARAEMGFPEIGGEASQLRRNTQAPVNDNGQTDALKAMKAAGYTADEAAKALKLEKAA